MEGKLLMQPCVKKTGVGREAPFSCMISPLLNSSLRYQCNKVLKRTQYTVADTLNSIHCGNV